MSYGRFFAMIATSTVIMFFLMYLNTYLLPHVFFSETRAYMALMMGATMAIIMLAFMLSMYADKAINAAVFLGAAAVFALSLWLVRSQVTVGDLSYLRAMIPHHSIAIMTSGRADISDPRVRKLADEIIYAQDKEIAEMRYLIAQIEATGDATGTTQDRQSAIVSLDQALSTDNVATIDPEFLTGEDIALLDAANGRCSFAYTKDSPAVLAIGSGANGAAALIKLSGDLVRLDAPERQSGDTALTFTADGISVWIAAPDGDDLADTDQGTRQFADLVLRLDRGLQAGFRGYYVCGA
jgi:hypothetical protein